mgnify:CR=1 FL=1
MARAEPDARIDPLVPAAVGHAPELGDAGGLGNAVLHEPLPLAGLAGAVRLLVDEGVADLAAPALAEERLAEPVFSPVFAPILEPILEPSDEPIAELLARFLPDFDAPPSAGGANQTFASSLAISMRNVTVPTFSNWPSATSLLIAGGGIRFALEVDGGVNAATAAQVIAAGADVLERNRTTLPGHV